LQHGTSNLQVATDTITTAVNLQGCKEMGGTTFLMPANQGRIQLASDQLNTGEQ